MLRPVDRRRGRRIRLGSGGLSPWEEDTVSIRCRKKRVRGRRIRSGFTSDNANIGFDRMVSNATFVMPAMR